MWTLSRECGIDTSSWYAELPLRNRVSMSAIGSVIVMRRLRSARLVSDGSSHFIFFLTTVPAGLSQRSDYQEAFVTPGSSPWCAISRRQIRHSPNFW